MFVGKLVLGCYLGSFSFWMLGMGNINGLMFFVLCVVFFGVG